MQGYIGVADGSLPRQEIGIRLSRQWFKQSIVAFSVSIAVHTFILLVVFMLHTEPPRLVTGRVIELSVNATEPKMRAVTQPVPAPPVKHQPISQTESKPQSDISSPVEDVAVNDLSQASALPQPDIEASEDVFTDARYDVASLHNPKPPYPLSVRRRGIQGKVILTAKVRVDGGCESVSLKQSSGHVALDIAALETVRQWRFVPARRGNLVVESWIEVPIVFRLDG